MAVAGGYDEEFVESISDHLKCCICHLVLKNPVQIMRCGHRYCALCFEQIETYSQHLKSPLICPIDREEINVAQVFDDTGMARMISDLKVRCSYHQEGCPWVGELRCLDNHKTSCQHVKHTTVVADNEAFMKDLCNRMDKYEEGLYEKEKEISHMKLLLQQTKDRVDMRDGEIAHLKEKTMEMDREIVSLKETNKTLQDNVSTVLLNCENYYLTNKTELMRLDKVVADTTIQCCDGEKINSLKDDMEELNRELTEFKFNTDSADETTSSRKALETDLLNIRKNMRKLEIGSKDMQGELNELKCTTSTMMESMSSIKDQLQNVEETVKETTEVDKVLQELDIVRGQQLCVDSLFRMNKPPLRSTRFTWTIDGFKERFEAKKQFVSPKFYCLPHGHLCQLFAQSENSLNMGLYIRICRGRNTHTTDFRVSILFDLIYSDGRKRPLTITSETVESLSNDVFTIKDGAEYSLGRGYANFFRVDEFDEYVKSDTCVVICTLTPAN